MFVILQLIQKLIQKLILRELIYVIPTSDLKFYHQLDGYK